MAVPAEALFLSMIFIPTYGLVGAVSLASCATLLIILATTMVFK